MSVLLITPPLLQCNAPYPATPLLTAFLRSQGIDAQQADASLLLLLRLLSREGLERVRDRLLEQAPDGAARGFLDACEYYLQTIDPVVRFLQGRDPTLAYRIVGRSFLPEGPRFVAADEQETDEDGSLGWAFGTMGIADQGRYLASLFVDDIAQAIQEGIDPGFGLSRYEERLAVSLPRLDPLLKRLEGPPTLIDTMMDEIALELFAQYRPGFVGFTVPFPGNLYGALRMARAFRQRDRDLPIALGGGYVNTELRSLSDPRLFDLVTYVCLDDGPAPLLAAVRHAQGIHSRERLVRTFVRTEGRVVFADDAAACDAGFADAPAPTYDGLPLDRYVSMVEMLNPMHALWSNGRWNKLMLAHGCYWRRCRFCDVSLDYIRRFEKVPAGVLADRIARVADETGQTGFHFVDEAAPPAVLRGLAEELLRRGLAISWWGNIRFERAFDPSLAALLAASGCIAVTGGLEAASDRLLRTIDKGITVAQAARVCHAFAQAGVLVHAYMMYGLPSQTGQETVDSLERVRQLFAEGCLHSAYWHRFCATVHSPIGQRPSDYGIVLDEMPDGGFAQNGVSFTDPAGADHDRLSAGLRKAVYNYMHGVGLDEDVRTWFDFPVPAPGVARRGIARAIASQR